MINNLSRSSSQGVRTETVSYQLKKIMQIDTNEWLPLNQAAEYVKVSSQSIINWYLSGNLTAIDPWNMDRLYSVEDLNKISKARNKLIATRDKRGG